MEASTGVIYDCAGCERPDPDARNICRFCGSRCELRVPPVLTAATKYNKHGLITHRQMLYILKQELVRLTKECAELADSIQHKEQELREAKQRYDEFRAPQ